MRSEIELHVRGKEIKLDNISNDEATNAINTIRENMHAHKAAQRVVVQQATTQTPSVLAEDPVQKLKQLKDMLDAGLISQKEYDSKKADILSRM
jgi:hypothetical protein